MAKLNHGRRRTLDPGFFTDERVLQLEPLARLMFQALWLLADREGRLEEPHPVQLKVRFFAMDQCDPAALLEQIIRVGLVLRYRARGVSCLSIPGFPKYQHPHKNEVASVLLSPFEAETAPTEEEAKTRAASAQEDCWDIMERLRVEHCQRIGIAPGESKKPKLCNAKLKGATEAAGIVDKIVGGVAFTRWDLLTLLFEWYLGESFGNEPDKNGQPRDPPWPIDLFLSTGVLKRLKRRYDEEVAA